jgi:hypothetical protein
MFMARQQECCPVVGMASKQADAGIAVQKTVIASINSALFLLQVMVSGFQVSSVIIRCWAFCGCDLDHAFEAWKTAAIDETDHGVRVLTADNSHSPNAEGANAMVIIMRCTADHTFRKKIAAIYTSAQQGAAQVVSDLEAHTNSASSAAQVIQELQRQLDATIRREAELRASNDETSAEDLKEQAEIERNLRESIAAYLAIPVADDAGQADRMRALQTKFSLLAQDAEDLVKIAETKCIAERKILGYLNLREQREKQIASWSELLPNPSTQDRPAKQPSRRPSSASVPPQETTQ